MANHAFLFEVTVHPKADRPEMTVQMASSGSVETRARRRLLDAIHSQNEFVKSIKCLDCRRI